jgi:uncharacterized membrane protein YeiH
MAAPVAAGRGARIVRAADLCGSFVFAVEGALAGIGAGFDPVGVLALAFATALGGGIARDAMIGALPVAAVAEWRYAALVVLAAVAVWGLHPAIAALPGMWLAGLDAAGLALFAVAGTQKALGRGIAGLPAMFLGTLGAVGGGMVRDVLLNRVPLVLHEDVYAVAALAGAAVVAGGSACRLPPRAAALAGGAVCFAVRIAALRWGWQLPHG